MKKLWTLIAITGLAGTMAVAAREAKTAQPAQPAEVKGAVNPRIQFDKLVCDFGRTSMVQTLTGKFIFENRGNGTLELGKPITSCGCTVAAAKPDKLEAGQKGELGFTLSVSSMVRGPIEKHITVPSNDSSQPAVQLAVKADIVLLYDLAPPQVVFGDLRVGVTNRVPIVVKRTDGANLVMSNAQSSSDLIHARMEPVPGYGASATKVWIEIAGQGTPRRVSESVAVFVESNAQPVATIPVFGRIVGDVSVSPETIFWGINDSNNWPGAFPDLMTKRVMRVVLNQPDKTLEIKNPVSTLADVELSVVAVETGKVYDVVLRLPRAPKSTERGTITFDTNIASQPTISVPLIINVMKRPLIEVVPPTLPKN